MIIPLGICPPDRDDDGYRELEREDRGWDCADEINDDRHDFEEIDRIIENQELNT